MPVSLSNKLEPRIKANLARLREKLKVGTDQLDRGEGIIIESKADLDSLFNKISWQGPNRYLK